MKTSIKTLIATSLIALTFSTSLVYANSDLKPNSISASAVNITSVRKLNISGNAEVTIVQNSKSKVLFTNDGTERVSVKKIGDAVYITSKTNAKITVYVDEIYRIEAAENAVVTTENPLTLKYLQVFTKDNAYVNVNAKTGSLFTSIKDNSTLNLEGDTDLYTIDMDKSSRISLQQFKSKKTDMSASDVYVASRR
ncbi:MAG: hypothetical protein EOO47_10405 [Flavobacterium sp.]|nr:MAG: hypothetical protein EOO47_10405 [Flavobacterium sp.]